MVGRGAGAGRAARPAAPALKEGRVAVRALESGRQVVVLRRGGLRERAFEAQEALPGRFALLPTEFHAAHLREGLAPSDFDGVGGGPGSAAAAAAGAGEVAVCSYAELTGAWAAPSESARPLFDALASAGLHIWSPEFFSARLERAKPGPTSVLELRVYLLAEPIFVREADFAGCFSWVDLGDAGAAGTASVLDAPAEPALGFLEFSRRQAALRVALDRAAPGCPRLAVRDSPGD